MTRKFKVGDIVDAKSDAYQLKSMPITEKRLFFVVGGKRFLARELTLVRAAPYPEQFKPAAFEFEDLMTSLTN